MEDIWLDICNCPDCHYFDIDADHCCRLPEQITGQDIPHIREAVCCCRCVNPRLWEFFESLEVAR